MQQTEGGKPTSRIMLAGEILRHKISTCLYFFLCFCVFACVYGLMRVCLCGSVFVYFFLVCLCVCLIFCGFVFVFLCLCV